MMHMNMLAVANATAACLSFCFCPHRSTLIFSPWVFDQGSLTVSGSVNSPRLTSAAFVDALTVQVLRMPRLEIAINDTQCMLEVRCKCNVARGQLLCSVGACCWES